ncbi:MAG TPA: hypothetical protein VFG62_18130, partial [Rhodopila sp.]|nr:hypothetical protein [Rhodopila sp.]
RRLKDWFSEPGDALAGAEKLPLALDAESAYLAACKDAPTAGPADFRRVRPALGDRWSGSG